MDSSDEEIVVSTKKKKAVQQFIDSDEEILENKHSQRETSEKNSDNESSENENQNKSPKNRRIVNLKGLVDSEDEDETKTASPQKKKADKKSLRKKKGFLEKMDEIKKKRESKRIVDSESSDSDSASDSSKTSKKSKSKSQSESSDISDSELSHLKGNVPAPKAKRASAAKAMGVIQRKLGATESSSNDHHEKKMTHKQAEDQRQLIQSESQRMERERDISVPYHKPKQFTLKEFLNRRSVVKASTVVKAEPNRKTIAAIKMKGEELDQFVRKLKEREKEAIEFFKSESEDEIDEEIKPSTEVPDKIEDFLKEVPRTDSEIIKDQVEIKIITANNEININEPIASTSEITESHMETQETPEIESLETNDTQKESVQIITDELEDTIIPIENVSDAIVAEKISEKDLEEPKKEETQKSEVDIQLEHLHNKYGSNSTQNQMENLPLDIEVKYDLDEDDIKETKSPLLTKISSIQLKKEPKILGDKDMIIDLESGDVQPRVLTGPERLFMRLMKNAGHKHKHKNSAVISVMNFENGKAEIDKVAIKFDEEEEIDHNKPGLAHEKLKESLREKILQKRMETIKLKYGDEQNVKKCEASASEDEFEPEDKQEIIEEDTEFTNGSDGEFDQNYDIDENEDIVPAKSKKKVPKEGSEFLDLEAQDEDTEQNEGSVEESSSSDESSDESDLETSEQEAGKMKKGRIIKAFEDSDEEVVETTENVNQENTEPIETQNDVFLMPQNPSIDFNLNKDSEEPFKLSEDDIFKTQNSDFTFSQPSLSEKQDGTSINELFDPMSQKQDDDLMDICSGQFITQKPDSQRFETENLFTQPTQHDLSELCSGQFMTQNNFDKNTDQLLESQFETQIPNVFEDKSQNSADMFETQVKNDKIENAEKPITNNSENLFTDSELLMSHSEMFVKNSEGLTENVDQVDSVVAEKPSSNLKSIKELLASSDEEIDDKKVEKPKIKKKKKKQKKKKLGFSDSEDELENSENICESAAEGEEIEGEDPEQEEVFIDYDSEENEIQVKMTKKDRQKAAKDYFENEAELSESEWGSADEDEKNLDKFDIELGDEDEFDQDQLQDEVGRIHMRRLLDDDAKAVKKLQDKLFEDEENDGVGRERKFRWKNNQEGFIMDDENARDFDQLNEADGGEADDQNTEILWRRMRHERDLIAEKTMNENSMNTTDILLLDHSSQTVTVSNQVSLSKRKITVVRSSSTVDKDLKKEHSFLIAKSNSSALSSRASFLSRDENTLSRIASLTKCSTETETMNIVQGKGNFVFSTLSPLANKNEGASNKRKSDQENSVENESKKIKVQHNPPNSKKKLMLIDQLA